MKIISVVIQAFDSEGLSHFILQDIPAKVRILTMAVILKFLLIC